MKNDWYTTPSIYTYVYSIKILILIIISIAVHFHLYVYTVCVLPIYCIVLHMRNWREERNEWKEKIISYSFEYSSWVTICNAHLFVGKWWWWWWWSNITCGRIRAHGLTLRRARLWSHLDQIACQIEWLDNYIIQFNHLAMCHMWAGLQVPLMHMKLNDELVLLCLRQRAGNASMALSID